MTSRSVPADDLASDIARFESEGYRLDLIRPADNPTHAQMSRHGKTIQLNVGDADGAELRSDTDHGDLQEVRGPTLADRLTISRQSEGGFEAGRAGMTYRDLFPERAGGRVIASHIRIDDAGPVADYVHYHDIDFQVIFCVAGWVDVVYEDQGPLFRLLPGDCVLQPPGIRHRVLRCSAGLEVVEVGSPAAHDTRVDHDLGLPNHAVEPERDFGGQNFVRHRATGCDWRPCARQGIEFKDTGIAGASRGAGSVEVIRVSHDSAADPEFACDLGNICHDHTEAGFVLGFVLAGGCAVGVDAAEGELSEAHRLSRADAFVLSGAGASSTHGRCWLTRCSSDFELLLVTLAT